MRKYPDIGLDVWKTLCKAYFVGNSLQTHIVGLLSQGLWMLRGERDWVRIQVGYASLQWLGGWTSQATEANFIIDSNNSGYFEH